jgi:hypothetical protein
VSFTLLAVAEVLTSPEREIVELAHGRRDKRRVAVLLSYRSAVARLIDGNQRDRVSAELR